MRGIKFFRPKEKDEHRAHELDRAPELADLVLYEMNTAESGNANSSFAENEQQQLSLHALPARQVQSSGFHGLPDPSSTFAIGVG